METAVDDMAQNIAKALAAVALGGAQHKQKFPDEKEPAKESLIMQKHMHIYMKNTNNNN